MAITLYRCSRCKGLFSSVWGTGSNMLCRACKTGTDAASVSGAVTIVEADDKAEPVVVNPADAGAMFFTSAGGFSKVDILNDLTRQVFEKRPELGVFAEPSKIAPWAVVGVPDPETGNVVMYENDSREEIKVERLPSGMLKLSRPLTRYSNGTLYTVDLIDAIAVPVKEEEESPRPSMEVSSGPHAAMLDPKRKLRISEK